ncbi:MAG TPA: ATP-binding protein [Methylomirabilota bacterium]|nr:ATP-binding protein [Methylomirabilota bacterium]
MATVKQCDAVPDFRAAEMDRRASAFLVFVGATVLLACALAIGVWIDQEGTRLGQSLARRIPAVAGDSGEVAATPSGLESLARETHGRVRRLAITAALAGVAMAGATMLGTTLGRRRWERRLARLQAQLDTAEMRAETAGLASQRLQTELARVNGEMKSLEAELERRVAARTEALASAKAALQSELNARRSAERLLAQQTKELERSKDVLGLHVQARTQELHKLQRLYESILNSVGEGIYGLDLHGRMTFVNPAAARLTGRTVEELVGKPEQEILRAGQAAGCLTEQGLKLDAQGNYLPEQTFIRKDGTRFPVEYTRAPLREGDRLVGAVVLFKDITERKRADEALARKAAELARSNAELEQFAYVASHDLQEPLRKIQAFGERLKARCDAANLADGRDYLERMQNASARMQTLINDLLTFSRVISASQPFVPVDLNAVIKEVLCDLEVRIEQTRAIIEVGPLPEVQADPLQMRQLFQNLIGNALKFQTPGTPPIVKIAGRVVKDPLALDLKAVGESGLCEITVRDNGIGFDEKYLDKIFAVFQRLHGRSEYEGTGVGLAVCRRIMERHGGTITARSRPGQGATFIVQFPIRPPSPALAP